MSRTKALMQADIDRLNAHCEKYREVIHELLRMAQLVKIRPAEQSAFIVAVNLAEVRKKYGIWVDGNERGMTFNIPHEDRPSA